MFSKRIIGNKRYPGTPVVGAVAGSLLVLVVLLILWWQVNEWYQRRLLADMRSQAVEDVTLRGNALIASINRRLALVDGLHAFVQAEADSWDFDVKFENFAASLYTSVPGIRNISVAPAGIVNNVYPPTAREETIGYNPLDDTQSEIRSDAERAVNTGQIVVSGPIELRQGGMGIVARQAVYQAQGYWGLVNIVADLAPILNRSGLDTQSDDFEYALRDNTGRVFLGTEETFTKDPLTYQIELPDGTWVLAGAPREGWNAAVYNGLLVFQTAGIIIIVLLTGLVYLTINRQSRLSSAVQQRTQEISQVNLQLQEDIAKRQLVEAELREREQQYRSIFESTTNGLIITDLEGNLVDFNPAASDLHGYSPEEFRSLQPDDFINSASLPTFVEFLETVKTNKHFRGYASDIKKDGTLINIEAFGTLFQYRGKPHALAVIRDITEEVKAYQLLEQRVHDRTQELSTLLEVSQSFVTTLELDFLLNLTLNQLGKIVNYFSAALFSMEEGRLKFQVCHSPTSPVEVCEQLHPFEQPDQSRWLLQKRSPLIINDVHSADQTASAFRDILANHFSQAFQQTHSWMWIPMVIKESIVGGISLTHQNPGHFTQRHAELAQTMAIQAAMAIENARLYKQAQVLAVLEERQRLARELHDSISQALYGISLGAHTARAQLERDPSNALKPIEYCLSLAEAGLTEMRALIFELRPDSLEEEGLVTALTKQAAALRARYQIEVVTELCEEPPINLELKETVYRVALEAMQNTVKHAQATTINLRLIQIDGELALEVADNGQGFDPQESYPGHLGLRSMQERVEQNGGIFKIQSSLGIGTSVRAQFNLNPP
jgi:PAS domain S-box-containing protein